MGVNKLPKNKMTDSVSASVSTPKKVNKLPKSKMTDSVSVSVSTPNNNNLRNKTTDSVSLLVSTLKKVTPSKYQEVGYNKDLPDTDYSQLDLFGYDVVYYF